jgi:hypothetical protein
MPVYTFKDVNGEWTTSMTIEEMEEMLEKNPHIQWVPNGSYPTLDSVRLGIRKPDEGFRDLLRTVKKGSPRSTVNIP